MIDLESIGLSIIFDFISPEEEQSLLEKLVKAPVKNTKGRNCIQRFGSSLPYKSDVVSNTIPEHFNFLLDRLQSQNLLNIRPDSVTVNQYLPKQMITSHIDSKTSGEVITVLSLLSEATMVFTDRRLSQKVVLPSRCLVQLRGDIRNKWFHAIEPVQEMRYSIVFRCSVPTHNKSSNSSLKK